MTTLLPPSLLWWLLAIASLVVVGMLISLVTQRLVRHRRERRRAELDERLPVCVPRFLSQTFFHQLNSFFFFKQKTAYEMRT